MTGAGERAFCAGGDLKEFSTLLDANPSSLLETLASNQRVLEKLEVLPLPVIAAVNGVAVAGGLCGGALVSAGMLSLRRPPPVGI